MTDAERLGRVRGDLEWIKFTISDAAHRGGDDPDPSGLIERVADALLEVIDILGGGP